MASDYIYTAGDIASRAGVTSKRVHQWMIAEGRRGISQWGRTLWTEADLLAFLARRRERGPRRKTPQPADAA